MPRDGLLLVWIRGGLCFPPRLTDGASGKPPVGSILFTCVRFLCAWASTPAFRAHRAFLKRLRDVQGDCNRFGESKAQAESHLYDVRAEEVHWPVPVESCGTSATAEGCLRRGFHVARVAKR